MRRSPIPLLFTLIFLAGCTKPESNTTSPTPSGLGGGPHAQVQAENQLFLNQKTFDPWVLTSNDPNHALPAYLSDGHDGCTIGPTGDQIAHYQAGHYVNGQLAAVSEFASFGRGGPSPGSHHVQTLPSESLDLYAGLIEPYGKVTSIFASDKWPEFWKTSDIEIDGDPEAQQVTHANMFYLASSTYAGSDHSIPPMGLSSNGYDGHIFWDAEIWMFPALIAQHPDLAKSIIDYRFKLLPQAMKNAAAHGYKGAEYPWESATDGKEEAPAEFAKERHISADVAYAAWQYYLWTGDKNYLLKEGYPILSATADYWDSRMKQGSDGKFHIDNVMPPDETAGVVNDDAWTNAIVKYNLRAAYQAITAQFPIAMTIDPSVDAPRWRYGTHDADKLALPFDKTKSIYIEYASVDESHLMAKQADAQMLIYPLNVPMSDAVAGKTLDYCLAHTIQFGPAMTSSINAIVAARLGRAQQSLDLFRDSYRPFERGPWDAFSEKRTTDNVYFCTGMGGCLQTVLYGFAGLNVVGDGDKGLGKQIAQVGDAALYCDPHLPPGWAKLLVKGIKFRGQTIYLTIGAGNTISVGR